jgi:hypothetical protein
MSFGPHQAGEGVEVIEVLDDAFQPDSQAEARSWSPSPCKMRRVSLPARPGESIQSYVLIRLTTALPRSVETSTDLDALITLTTTILASRFELATMLFAASIQTPKLHVSTDMPEIGNCGAACVVIAVHVPASQLLHQ